VSRRAAAFSAALAVVLAGAGVRDGAGRAVDGTLQRARAIVLGDGERSEKLQSLHALARELLDTRAMGHRAFGRELAERPPAQQEEFLQLFDALMVRSYLQKLLLFRDPDFAVVGEEERGGRVVVFTRIFTPKDEFLVDYEMSLRSGRWLAVDVVIEGISLTRNYHDQLHALLRSHDFEELLERMRVKTRRLGS
jgi:phospholipid transport system substrate-binding protein